MCGSVMKTQPSYTFTETTGRPGVLAALGDAPEGGGARSARASRSGRAREPVFTPRDFSLLANYQAICLPYDGVKSLPGRRVLSEAPLSATRRGLLAAPRGGPDMKRGERDRASEAVPARTRGRARRSGGLRADDQRPRQRLGRTRAGSSSPSRRPSSPPPRSTGRPSTSPARSGSIPRPGPSSTRGSTTARGSPYALRRPAPTWR